MYKMSDLMDGLNQMNGKPFKLVDADREIKLGIVAGSIWELEHRARIKFDVDGCSMIRIVLEADGTEIDENDYFVTLEADTTLMVLVDGQSWTPYKSNFSLGLALEPPCSDEDECEFHCNHVRNHNNRRSVEDLIWRLRQDLSFFPWLSEKELTNIAKMDKEEMSKIIPDAQFLEFIQDLCQKYLQEKETSGSDGSGSGESTTGSILNDPIQLIKLYSKSKHYLNTRGSTERLPQI